tara:strand:- start:17401 stop:21453 length:4053 start_codon:yes stop_codon:yes gene_type:complete
MNNAFNYLILILFAISFNVNSQTKFIQASSKSDTYKVTQTINLDYKYVPSIRELIENGTFIPADPNEFKKDGPPKRLMANKVVPGKGLPKGNDPLVDINTEINKKQTRDPILTFQTTSSTATPGDPTGEVGRDYYLASWNSSFRFFNLDGSPATPNTSLNNLFGPNQSGDPIVLYDSEADRYVISSMGSSSLNFAVSVSNDPVNDGWHVYNASSNQFPTSGQFPDYPKYSIWSDGYYCTTNTGGDNLFVLERDKILNGDTTASLQAFDTPSMSTSGFASAQIFDIVDDNHPSSGNATLVYLQDDSWFGVASDHLKIWTVNVDWNNPSNSSISNPTELSTSAFNSVFDGGSFSNLPQPSGPDIDAMQATIMNQAQFRKFATHNSAVLNFVVNTASSGELAGVRWFELRQDGDGQPWTIFQEGTYTAPDGRHAFGASMSIDLQGNIGMGYSSLSSTESISLRYTGRYAADPLGQMTLEEGLIAQSTGNSTNLRYADYAHMSVEPVNDKQFWYVSEYFSPGRSHIVGVFQIAADAAFDAGVTTIDSPVSGSLTDSESVIVSIFNYGENEISNFDISFQLDDGAIITETFTGSIGTGETAQHTFSTLVDMSIVGTTYSITAYTSLDNDENQANDSVTADITHLNPNDLGVSGVSSPTSGELLTNAEPVTITITNYGGATQYDFDVTYEINGETVTETVSGPLEGNSSMEYTFVQTADLSAFGSYSIYVYTSLDGDSDPANDTWQASVTNVNCAPSMDCSFGDGLQLFQFGDINNESGCEGYGDFTDQSTDVELGESYDITMTTGYGDQWVRIWIDYNDDFNFTLDELILDNYEIADGSAGGSYTETVNVIIPTSASLGQHLMRVKTSWATVLVPDDACEVTPYGETEDYMINILPAAENDIGVINITNPVTGSLSATETITIEIFNFGENDASNFDVSYSVNGGGLVTETFSGTIASGESVEYSFDTTADMSQMEAFYLIFASVSLDGDEDSGNDSLEVEIQYLIDFDLGVSAIASPASGVLLSNSEQVVIAITNYGGLTQSDFDVTFEIIFPDGSSQIQTETVAGPLPGNSSMSYTFDQTIDLSIPGNYSLIVSTMLLGDDVPSNDSLSTEIVNSNCAPSMNCAVGDGLTLFQLLDIDNTSGCEGYGDFTDMITNVEQGGTHDVTMTTGYGNQYVRIWIDFNDDYAYTSDELVLDNYIIAQGSASGSYTETTQINIPADAPLGQHSMRVKTNWNANVPDDACELTTYGETEDYMVNIVTSLGFGELELDNSQFKIYSSDNYNFTIKLSTNYSDLLTFSVYDVYGKIIVFNNIEKTNGLSYIYELDMSYMSAGVYLVKMGNSTVGFKTGRIIVK